MDNTLTNFIENFFRDFEGEITENVYTKLLILKLIQENKKAEEIQSEIKVAMRKKIKLDSIKRNISRYKKSCTKIQELPSFIQIKNIVKIINKKYPNPLLIGLHFDCWNDIYMYDFICYNFKLSNPDQIKIDTIRRYLDTLKRSNICLEETDTFYYITIISKRYHCIPFHHQGNKQYDYLYYGAIFYIYDDGFTKDGETTVSITSYANNEVHSFKPFISALLKKIPNNPLKKPIIFIRKSDEYKNSIFRKQEDFHEYFRFNWCVFKNLRELNEILDTKTFKIKPSDVNNLKQILNQFEELEKECSNIDIPFQNLDSFIEEKKGYLKEINSIFKEN